MAAAFQPSVYFRLEIVRAIAFPDFLEVDRKALLKLIPPNRLRADVEILSNFDSRPDNLGRFFGVSIHQQYP